MVVNVGRFNKAEKPNFKEPEQVDRQDEALFNALGKGVEGALQFASATTRFQDAKNYEAYRIAKLKENEDKSQATKDFTDFQNEFAYKFEELQAKDKGDLLKDTDTAFRQMKEKKLEGKSVAYRKALNELANNMYASSVPNIINKASENAKLRTVSYLQEAADNTVANRTSFNKDQLYSAGKMIGDQISNLDIPEYLKTAMIRQNDKNFVGAAVENMIEQNPESAYIFIDNDETVNNLFNEEQKLAYKKIANDTLFTQLAKQNPVDLYELMQDDKKAKQTFKTFSDKDILTYKNKAKQYYKNYEAELKFEKEIKKLNAIANFQRSQPTRAGLEKLFLSQPNLKKDEKTMLEEWTDTVIKKGVDTVNTELVPQLTQMINNVEKIDVSDDNSLAELAKSLFNARKTILDCNKKEIMSEEDFKKFDNSFVNIANKAFVKNLQENIEDIKPLLIEGRSVDLNSQYGYKEMAKLSQEQRRDIFKRKLAENLSFRKDEKIAEVAKDCIASYMLSIANNDIDGAKRIATEAKRKIADIKYPFLKNLKNGDVFLRNNVVYVFEGMANDKPIITIK